MSKQVKTQITDDNFNIIKNDVARIRAVPSMYISSIGEMGVFHLCKEIIDNNYDECYKKKSPGSYVLLFLAKAKGSFLCNKNGLSFSPMLHIHFCQAKSCFPRRKQLKLK